ncbi:RidA family protein [Hyphobacterium sp. HN65]|uniref:RidA family protein n=1 Tax=Hyphobacterium lacteum TaxID=3116575 RepID=A0ABU7LLN3_9PROT|nr:RidA family protein [Hyphobacterium sp. HN65]MEE2524831.1 RidA family protein [Hyphobacterium sp. HN65]
MKKLILSSLLAVSAIACAHAQESRDMEIYRVEGLPDWAPFSSVVRAGDMLYVSGHLGRHPGTTEIVEGGAGPETTQTMANIETSLALAGADLSDLVTCTVYLTDMADYPAMNEAYAAALNGHQPARVTAGIQALALGARVEIACVAYAPIEE